MAWELRITHLDVGQGTGEYISLVDSSTGIVGHNMMLDLGSEQAKRRAGGPSVEWVVAHLKMNTDQPKLDVVLFSHSDSDHVNLIKKLLDSFEAYDPDNRKTGINTLIIRHVAYGGDYDKYKKGKQKNVIDILKPYMKYNQPPFRTEPVPIDLAHSSFNVSPAAPLVQLGPLAVYLVAGNVPNVTPGAGYGKRALEVVDGYSINTLSMVVALSFFGWQAILTGDATGATLVWCNNKMTDAVRRQYLNNVVTMSMPHHGSSVTTFNTGKVGKGTTARENISQFATNAHARTIHASAGLHNSFKHPSAEVLSFFWDWKYTDIVPHWQEEGLEGNHFYTANFDRSYHFDKVVKNKKSPWPHKDEWYTVQSRHNVYTNTYYADEYANQDSIVLPPLPATTKEVPTTVVNWGISVPPMGVAWQFRLPEAATGNLQLYRLVNRPNLLLLRSAIIDGVPPEDLPQVPVEEVEQEPQPPEGAATSARPAGWPGASRGPAGQADGAGPMPGQAAAAGARLRGLERVP
jgi:hypothetical protein